MGPLTLILCQFLSGVIGHYISSGRNREEKIGLAFGMLWGTLLWWIGMMFYFVFSTIAEQ